MANGTPAPVSMERGFAVQYGVNWAVKAEYIRLKYLVTGWN